MKKIYECTKIETWGIIASKVQQLNFVDGTEKEFQENLASLNKILQELGIEESIGKRTPNSADEIGTASLLQSIQDINVPNNYKKATFYEKIYQLVDLGVQEIEFCPFDFFNEVRDLRKMPYGSVILEKCYTDGTFQLLEASVGNKYGNKYIYNLYNLCNANYLLFTTLSRHLFNTEKYRIKQELTQVALKNFNGIYPSKEEIMKFEFPELAVAKQGLIWGESPRVKEKFETFDRQTSSYQKRLKRDSNNQYYYE